MLQETHQEIGRRGRPARAALRTMQPLGVLLLLAALATPVPSQAQSVEKRDSASRPAARSVRSARKLVVLPLNLGEQDLLGTEYLRRALRESIREDSSDAVRKYASRYKITPQLARQIVETAVAEGVDPELAFRLVRTESRFSARARGPQGALGLTQLMFGTARSVDPSLHTEAAILDPTNNLRVGFRYLRMMIEKFDGDVRLGLLAYNRGEGTVGRALRRGQDPENGYSQKVLSKGSNRYKGRGLLPSR